MTGSDLDLRLQRFRARREGSPEALAEALIESGRSQDALEVVHLSLLDGEPAVELLTLEGTALYEQGDLREAQAALLRAIKSDPLYKEAYRRLGQVLIERGDPKRAVQVLERAVRLDPRDAGLRQALSRAQRLMAPQSRGSQATRGSRPGDSQRPSSRPGDSQRPSSRPGSVRPEGASRASSAVRGGRPARALPDPLAQALLDERPAGSRSYPPAAPATGRRTEALPFDDELEHDDAPTRAIDLSDELRTLRASERAQQAVLHSPFPRHAYEDEDPTSILPSARELEQVGHPSDAETFEEGVGDATMIGTPAMLAEPGRPEQPEQVLGVLRAHGVFESTTATPPKAPAGRRARRSSAGAAQS